MKSFFKKFNSVELITFIYGLATAAYILILFPKIEKPAMLLFSRLCIFVGMYVLVLISEKYPNKIVRFVRYAIPFAFIAYWYPETYYLNHGLEKMGQLAGELIVPNLDRFFDQLDFTLFGCSPAMEFSKTFPQAIVSEIMYFGYFAYYLIFVFVFSYFFFVKRHLAEQAMFYSLCSFFIFYVIFIFVPVSGPQFYYAYPDNQVPDGYFFSSLMRAIQSSGEKPTGAFPSSHVGLTLIAMYLLFLHARKYFYLLLPVAIILTASTVYIKAHYLIDVVCAFIFTPIIYLASKKIYKIKFFR